MTDEQDDPVTIEGVSGLAADLDRLNSLKLEKKAIDDEIEYLQASIVKEMNAAETETVGFYDTKGNPVQASVVQGTQRAWDLDILAKDARLYKAVTKITVNPAVWDKAVKMGIVPQEILAAEVSKPKKPYILFSSPLEEASDD